MSIPLLDPWQDWFCPNCPTAERTRPLPVNASRWHPCAGLHGLKAPLVRAGTDAKVEALQREDYLHGEVQRTGDDGRPYAGVRTERADGSNDLAVFAPLARASIREVL